jgi:Fe-S-cluster containining protein
MPAVPLPPPADRTPRPLVRLGATGAATGSAPTATANIQLAIGGQRLRLEITVPAGPSRPQDLLPVLQGLTDVVVGIAVRGVEGQGQAVSCRKGCGACCRQLVPISESEARALAQGVAAMPEPRRSRVRARFAEARERLEAAGLLDQLRHPERVADPHVVALGLSYFGLGLACPFLEEESCSIHPDRPLSCREYLVTSPADACARPSAETVRRVPLPARVAGAARAVDRQASASAGGWVPLVLALEWAEAHPDGPPPSPGPALLQRVFAHLADRPD